MNLGSILPKRLGSRAVGAGRPMSPEAKICPPVTILRKHEIRERIKTSNAYFDVFLYLLIVCLHFSHINTILGFLIA